MNASTLQRVLRRRLLVLPIAVLGVMAIAQLAALATDSSEHLAEAVVVVRAGASGDDPGSPRDASDLATSYVRSIPEDGGVIRAVADVVGGDPDDVAEHISALGTLDTALIRLRFDAGSEAEALAGARALQAAVSGEQPRSRSVGARVLTEVRAARIVDAPSGGGLPTLIASLILGLLLALIVILGLERSDPRIDTVDELGEELETGITDLAHVDHSNIGLLLDRWVELSDRPASDDAPVRVGLIPTEGAISSREIALKIRLIAAAADYPVTVDGRWDDGHEAEHARSTLRPALDLVSAQPTGTAGVRAGEHLARQVDVVTLIVPAGLRVATLRTTLRTLHEFGTTTVAWAVLVEPADHEPVHHPTVPPV